MDGDGFLLLLSELDDRYTLDEKLEIVELIESDVDSSENLTIDIALCAPYIHFLFSSGDYRMHAAILKLCALLEVVLQRPVAELGKFDLLLTFSLGNPDPNDVKSDELFAAFLYLHVILQLTQHVSSWVLRGLIRLYHSNESMHKAAALYLAECSLCCDSIGEFRDVIGHVLIRHLAESDSPAIASLISYSLEHSLPLVQDHRLFWSLFNPISSPGAPIPNSISLLLRTWPGIACFGLESGTFVSLIRCLPHQPAGVIAILRAGLRINRSFAAITDPFCGLFLAALVDAGLVQELCRLTDVGEAVDFLNEILPLTAHSAVTRPDAAHILEAASISAPHIPIALLLKQCGAMPQPPRRGLPVPSLKAIAKADLTQCSWTDVTTLFTDPDVEGQAGFEKDLGQACAVLFPYFQKELCSAQISETKSAQYAQHFHALIKLILSRGLAAKMGLGQVSSKGKVTHPLKATLEHFLDQLDKGVDIKEKPGLWAIFRAYRILLCCSDGDNVLTLWNLKKGFDNFAAKSDNQPLCETILAEFGFEDESGNDYVTAIFTRFLHSSFAGHSAAIADLRKKRPGMPPAMFINIVMTLILVHIKSLAAAASQPDSSPWLRLVVDINFLGEIIWTDEDALKKVAADNTLLKILHDHFHFVLALLFSQAAMLPGPFIQTEIDWWVSTGCFDYVELYDRAVTGAFTGILDVKTTKQPAIYNFNGTTVLPAHLFSELAKSQDWVEKLVGPVRALLEALDSDDVPIAKQRAVFFAAAHFASSPLAIPAVREMRLPESLIDAASISGSYVLNGTLVVCLSMFAPSDYFSSVLDARGWRLFQFGCHQAVIPVDPLRVMSACAPEVKNPPPIAEYAYAIEAAQKVGNGLPIIPITVTPPNTEKRALIGARISQRLEDERNPKNKRGLRSCQSLVETELPTLTLSQIKAKGPGVKYPEVYLTREAFEAATHISKAKFYEMGEEEKAAIRRTLRG
jgi:hypothetical protein